MKFIPLDPSLAVPWDQVARNSDDAWIFHLYDWLVLTEPNWDLESKSFLVEFEGNIVGIFPLQLKRKSKSLKSTYMGLGGAALINGLQAGERNMLLKAMHEHVHAIACESQSPFIEICLSPLSEASLQNQWQINPLIHYFYEDVSTHTWIIDLKYSEEEIMNGYSQVARKKIRAAHKDGYTLSEVKALSQMDELYDMHCENRKRTGAETHPKDFFEGFYKSFCEKSLAVMLQAMDSQGKPVAFRATGFFKNSALSWMASCKTDHLDSGVNYLLHHHSIILAKRRGLKWFESGEAFPNIQEGKLHGLTEFKGKFGGQLHRFYKGRLTLMKDTNSESEFKKWIKSTIALFRPILGERLTGFIRAISRNIYYFIRRIYQWIQGLNRVRFIKPCWGLQEFLAVFLYKDTDADKSVEEMLNKFRQILGAKGAVVATSSARSALELALKVLKVQYPSKNKVILSTYNCKGVFDPIINAGLIPVFADIDEDLNISNFSVKNKLEKEDRVLAVIVAHMGGALADIQQIQQICKVKEVIVIEDACQALGARITGRLLGTQQDMSIFSFGMGKNVMASAGGILVSNILKEEIDEEAKKLEVEETPLVKSRFGRLIQKYFFKLNPSLDAQIHSSYRYNKMHPIDAKIVFLQLDKLESIMQKRIENAKTLIAALNGAHAGFSTPHTEGHVFTKLSVIAKDAQADARLREKLNKSGIEIEEMYTPLHLRDFGQKFSGKEDLSFCENTYKRVFNIPVRPNLSELQLNRIKKAIDGH